jgi:uncharacterized membrane protein YhhN
MFDCTWFTVQLAMSVCQALVYPLPDNVAAGSAAFTGARLLPATGVET